MTIELFSSLYSSLETILLDEDYGDYYSISTIETFFTFTASFTSYPNYFNPDSESSYDGISFNSFAFAISVFTLSLNSDFI